MPKNKWMMGMLSLVAAVTLSACNSGNETSEEPMDMDNNAAEENMSEDSGHMNMDHSGSGEVPADLKEAENPTYEVGSQAIIETDHMEGVCCFTMNLCSFYGVSVFPFSLEYRGKASK